MCIHPVPFLEKKHVSFYAKPTKQINDVYNSVYLTSCVAGIPIYEF